ncbi:hypothetical protein E2C01_040499 [Portunus trituberculatus]|uniref:Uncharacterized protein n=1 Tax=Portunus trituberculatus TaxID=210409 RepID=A0A5B7FNY1_PORTR|nr:hypothetical protein [Portunus trituberculatus]
MNYSEGGGERGTSLESSKVELFAKLFSAPVLLFLPMSHLHSVHEQHRSAGSGDDCSPPDS